MLFEHTTSQALLSLLSNCVKASSEPQDIANVLEELNNIIPFESAIIVLDTELNFALKDQQQVVSYNLDHAWPEIYFKRQFYNVDPILKAVNEVDQVVKWQDVYNNTRFDAVEFKNMAKQYVGENGLSILRKNQQGSTLISLVFSHEDIEQWRDILEFVTPHIHEIFNREGQYQRKTLWQPQLTDRELDVLNWVKEGKSNWDISQLLSISERTVKFHLSNIYEKLSVVNRSQSIAKAIHFGLIST
ncbi:LuxR family transcriptional regulator [Saccharobesus litoralis]|uniref:LuxR family transcriptional regulator n=1 Tax=Saccharobesus litoralis TaxID=2172099 RepID=A0A2S0VPF0_9ALTE|nr:LuxR family transcriptional regulator [Saccharobesus litoralis]AWB66084.1 LuxR family transcriptional regulator [Saccharobesus litoralis]